MPSDPAGPATIGVAVLTRNARACLPHCLGPLLASPLAPRVLVVDSSSSDGTRDLAESLGAETLSIDPARFNHGQTRERARHHLGTDIVVLMSQDAFPEDEHMLGRLVAPLRTGEASLAYARQVPRQGAGLLEAYSRRFSFGPESHVRGLGDAPRYGPFLFYNSNACAAYRNAALDEIGGFRRVVSHEDSLAAAMLLKRGHKIAYVAEAVVRHSHRCSLRHDFTRLFDAGLARAQNADTYALGAGPQERLGWQYARGLLKEACCTRPWLLPYACAHLGVRLGAYRLGRASVHAPRWWNRALSGQKAYWEDPGGESA